MGKPLRALIVEDSPDDAELMVWDLSSGGFDVSSRRVETADGFLAALEEQTWDVILSEYRLPQLSALDALRIVQHRRLNLPFLIVSGAICEETAISLIKAGAHDCISKNRLTRLGPVVERELLEASVREQKQRAETIERQRQLEHEQADQQIREQARLLNLAQDAILVCDLEDRIHYWNKGAERLYSWTVHEVVGFNAAELLYGKSPAFQTAKRQVLDKGEWSGELNQLTKFGQEIVVNSRWTLVCDSANRPKSILIINSDITEKKRLEAQFLHAQRLESIGTLASGIAHDLNNILAPILMGAQMLHMRALGGESAQLVSMIEANAQHGAEIVTQLLSFSRRVEGKKRLIQPRHLIAEVVRMTKRIFPKTISFNSGVSSDLWAVSGDATQLHQVLLNLCVNARDAMPGGGTLTITGQNVVLDSAYASMVREAKAGSYVLLEVLDTGVGIPKEIIDKIFDPFFTTKEEGKGTGLGLSSVLGIVKSHGGFVEVRSVTSQGTAFRVFLPAILEQPLASPAHPHAAPPRGQGELVLIAEDTSDIRDVTQQILTGHGYEVLLAADGVEALVLAARHLPDIKLVLTDLQMPVMDGWALIRAVRKLNPKIRIIASTGNVETTKTEEELLALNVKSILAKPYTAEELLSALHETLVNRL